MLELLFLLLPVAAAYGWYMGRRSAQQNKQDEANRLSRDYVAGVNFLLSNQQDKAVDLFLDMLKEDTGTVEAHLTLGNLFRECGVVKQLSETASNALMYIVVILLGTSVGASTSAEAFLNVDTLKIVVLGLVAFACGTFGGVMLGKLLCKVTHGKINPLIGSAGVSAVPMAARVSQKVGAEADPTNFLLMHAMGPNVAGVIGTAVAAGTFMAIFGV